MDAQSYSDLAGLTQTASLILFVSLFALILAYALWPRNDKVFDRAAHIPLHDDGPQTDEDAASQSRTSKE